MLRKDLGLLILILVVGAVVALINPRFLSPVNMANTANLIGLFGIFSLGEGLVIITGGIDLSIGSVFALLGVIFVDLLVTYELPWPLAVLIILVAGTLGVPTALSAKPPSLSAARLGEQPGEAQWAWRNSTPCRASRIRLGVGTSWP